MARSATHGAGRTHGGKPRRERIGVFARSKLDGLASVHVVQGQRPTDPFQRDRGLGAHQPRRDPEWHQDRPEVDPGRRDLVKHDRIPFQADLPREGAYRVRGQEQVEATVQRRGHQRYGAPDLEGFRHTRHERQTRSKLEKPLHEKQKARELDDELNVRAP